MTGCTAQRSSLAAHRRADLAELRHRDVECVLDHGFGGRRDLLVSGCVGVVAVVGEVMGFVVGVVGAFEASPTSRILA